MQITGIKEQKNNKDRYSVYIDERYSFSISANDLLEAKLKTGSTLSADQISNFVSQSADSLLMSRTYEKCMRRPHSEKEIRDYLRTKNADEGLTQRIIDECYHYGLLDDEVFAQKWTQHRLRSNRSIRYIRNELRNKGVADEIIEACTSSHSDTSQLQALIEKKRGKYDDVRKLIAYLQRQGYSYSDISEQIKIGED